MTGVDCYLCDHLLLVHIHTMVLKKSWIHYIYIEWGVGRLYWTLTPGYFSLFPRIKKLHRIHLPLIITHSDSPDMLQPAETIL